MRKKFITCFCFVLVVWSIGLANPPKEKWNKLFNGKDLSGWKQVNGKAKYEVVDGVILWWREGDNDLVDELVDALTFLTENGPIWLLTPKAGRAGHVEPSDIQDSAPTAGLSQTSSFAAATDWSATRLVARKAAKR